MIKVGNMRRLIKIQKLSASRDSYGQPVEDWSNIATVWASVEPLTLRAREFLAAQQINSEITIRIRIRYRPGIIASMRVLYGTRIFDILAVIDPEERHQELQLMCKELTLDAG